MARSQDERDEASRALGALAHDAATAAKSIESVPVLEPRNRATAPSPADAQGLETACAKGDARACLDRGKLAFDAAGSAVAGQTAALAFFQKACALDPKTGCLESGVAQLSWGGPSGRAKALGFFERGCNAGILQACHDLAHLFEGGIGVKADPARARGFYQKACAGGFERSCQWLKQASPRAERD
jgi:hypothetical protein